MRKLLFLCCMVCFMLVGCSNGVDENTEMNTVSDNTETQQENELKESVFSLSDSLDIQMEIVVQESDDKKIVVNVINNSDYSTMFGEWFEIEKYEDGVWYQIPIREDIVFNSLGYPVEPYSTRELTFQFNYIYELEAFQKYRIVTYFVYDNGDKHYISDEFEIGILTN